MLFKGVPEVRLCRHAEGVLRCDFEIGKAVRLGFQERDSSTFFCIFHVIGPQGIASDHWQLEIPRATIGTHSRPRPLLAGCKKKRRLVLAARLKVPWPLGFLHAAPDA